MDATSNRKFFNSSPQMTIHRLLAILLLCCAFLYVYFDTIKYTISGWFNYNGSHSPVILAISIYIIWSKKSYLSKCKIESNYFAGFLVIIFGGLILIVGKIGAILLVQELSIIVTILGQILLLFGYRFMKLLFLPIGYLIFMFPIFEELLGNFSIYFQEVGAYIATSILKLWGFAVHRYGQFIELPHIQLEVAKICSGINSITALVSLAIPLSYITKKSIYGKLAFIFFAFLIGILSNGLRIALIGLWTKYSGIESIHGPFGIFYASFVFFCVFILFIFFFLRFRYFKVKENLSFNTESVKICSPVFNNTLNYPSILIGLFLLTITGLVSNWYKPIPVFLKNNLDGIPKVFAEWSGYDVDRLNNHLDSFNSSSKMPEPDNILKREYKDPKGNMVKLYVGYFASQYQGKEFVSYQYDWLHDNAVKVTSVKAGSKNFEINSTRYRFKGEQLNAYFWYNINGHNFVNRYKVKMATILNAALNKRTDGSIIVITFQKGRQVYEAEFNNSVMNFIREFEVVFQNFMVHQRRVNQ